MNGEVFAVQLVGAFLAVSVAHLIVWWRNRD